MLELIKISYIFLTATWLRTTCLSLTIVLISEHLFRRWRKFMEFKRRMDKIPGPPINLVAPLLGNLPVTVLGLPFAKQKESEEFYTSQLQASFALANYFSDQQIVRIWIGLDPIVLVWKPEMVELVLADNFLLEKSYHYDFLRPWLGNGLLTSPGKIWRPRRKLLVPSFHFNILQAFVPVFDRKSKLMVRNIKRKINEQIFLNESKISKKDDRSSTVVDITPVITACTLDAICETIMGVSIDAQEKPDNDYCQSLYIVGQTFLERLLQPRYWFDLLFKFTELGKLYHYHLDKLHTFTRTVIYEKKKLLNMEYNGLGKFDSDSSFTASNVKVMQKTTVDSFQERKQEIPKLPKAFLDLLLDKMNLPGGLKLTDEEIREEVDTFMFEGHDTTAVALSWTLFLLGHNQIAQEKLRNEVDQVCSELQLNDETNLELDHIKKLKYLDCVIKEALRLFPSVPFIGRKTTTDMKLGDHEVPAGCYILVMIYQLHRNSEIFPNPDKFDPDRFLHENTLGRHPFAYVPFSAGPRNCIGQKYAMAEMKTILLHMMRNFEFESITPLDKIKIQMEMVTRPKCALNIRIRPRINKN